MALALAGNLLAIAIYALATLLGLALLLAAAPSVRLGVYVLGGAYLVWVGRASGARRPGAAAGRRRRCDAVDGSAGRSGGPFLQGVLTALANVQALFFLASIFAGVGILAANPATQLAAIGIIVAGNGRYLSLLAWLMQREAARAFYARNRGLMEIGFGLLFVASERGSCCGSGGMASLKRKPARHHARAGGHLRPTWRAYLRGSPLRGDDALPSPSRRLGRSSRSRRGGRSRWCSSSGSPSGRGISLPVAWSTIFMERRTLPRSSKPSSLT